MTRGPWRCLAVGLAAAVLACVPTHARDDDVPTITIEERITFVRRVTADGSLKATQATPVLAPEDSDHPLKIAWLADDGNIVAAGDLVVRFDVSEMQRLLDDSEDDVASAHAKIEKERTAGTVAARKRDRTADLADVQVETAHAFEAKDASFLSRNEIIESQIDVGLARAKAEHAHAVKQVEHAVTANKIELHEIERRTAGREVERARQGLTHLEVRAPQAGVLVLERDWRGQTLRVGDTVWRGQKLAELPHVDAMEVELFVLEADAGDVTVGLPVEVVLEAHPDVVIAGTVTRIDTLAKPMHYEVPVQYFGVTVALERTDPALMKVGGRVHATIVIETRDVVVIPRQAVFEEDGKTYVHRRGEHGFERVPVTLGSSSAGRIVVKAGLATGDRVALRDPNRKTDEPTPAQPPPQGGPSPQ